MKLSNETLSILKNFSQINSGIIFKQGSILRTISQERICLAEANISESFPKTFGIYDLNNFLSVISLFKDSSELHFDDSSVYISSKTSSIQYRMTNQDMIFDERNLQLILQDKRPEVSADLKFSLSQEQFERMFKVANVLSSPNVGIESDGEVVNLICFDANNDSCNKHSMILSDVDPEGKKFLLVFKTENLKVMPKSYTVEVSFGGISKFSDVDNVLTYWIALDGKSKYF